MSRSTRGFLLTLLVALGACTTPTEPRFPRDAVSLDAQPQFALWWRMTEACSGLRGDLGAVRWFVQPGVETLHVPGEADGQYGGYWWAQGNRILLTEKAVTDGWLVRHEMLHALVGRAGHRRSEFVDRCGGIVTCTGECQREAGPDPQPPADAVEIDARELDVTVSVVPSTSFGLHDNGGWFAYVVTATNPRPEAVWVRVRRPRPDARGAATFGFVEGPSVWDYAWTTEPRVAFGPWQTKRYTYDRAAITGAGYAYKAGAHMVRGFFNNDTTPPVEFTILPKPSGR
ncbi:MAG: hypothetical protein ABR499_01945 [Gemmatimonadaceae bacterium]